MEAGRLMALMRTLFSFLVIAALLSTTVGSVAAQSTPQDTPGDSLPAITNSQRLNLMEPIQDLISGPGWLMARGLDVRPHGELPELNPLTGYPLEQVNNPMTGLNRPTAQGAPGVLVPYRDPAPSFSRSLLVTPRLQ